MRKFNITGKMNMFKVQGYVYNIRNRFSLYLSKKNLLFKFRNV